MDLVTLLGRLAYLGAAVVLRDGRPALTFPPGTPTDGLAAELGPALREHRDAVLGTYGVTPEPEARACGECGGWTYVWEGDTDTAFRACGKAMCPHWRPGLGPDWLAGYRRQEQRRRDAAARADIDPVPE